MGDNASERQPSSGLLPTLGPYRAVVIGGSAGSFQPVVRLLSELPREFSLPLFLCLHRLKHVRHGFEEALSIKSIKPVREPADKELVASGQVYLAPANYHLLLEPQGHMALSTDELVNNARPSIDLLFESAAYAYGPHLLAILLSGANRDGAWGMRKVKELGGTVVVQAPESCMISTMPEAAMRETKVDLVLDVDGIVALVQQVLR